MKTTANALHHETIRSIRKLDITHGLPSKLFIPDQDGYQVILLEEITSLNSKGNYTEIHLNNNKHFIFSKTLKTFEKILPKSFFRIHHQFIINKEFITRVDNSGSIHLKFGKQFPLARSRKNQFFNWFVDGNIISVH